MIFGIYIPIPSLGRSIDRAPWDWIQIAVMGSLFFTGLLFFWVFFVRIPVDLVFNTIGTLSLAGYGALLGLIVIAPAPVWFMKRSSTYARMDRKNAWACRYVVRFDAAVICYALLLCLNSPRGEAASSTQDAVVTAWRHPTGLNYAWTVGTLTVQTQGYGRREINVPARVWNLAVAHRQIKLISEEGRLGYPILTGCKVMGIEGAQPLRK